MRRNRILHLADLHLGQDHTYLGGKAGRRAQEADSLLTRLVDRILTGDDGIGGVIIAGDLFDAHNPPRDLVQTVIADLGRLRSAGVRIATVPGNHDEYSYPSCVYRQEAGRWPDLLVTQPNTVKIDTWDLDGCAVDLYAMAYVAGRSRPPYDRFSIEPGAARKLAVLHGSLDAPWSDRSLPLSSSNIAELDLDYLALGHIHRPAERHLGRLWAVYPGRIEGSGFDDPGGADLVTVEFTETDVVLRHLPWSSRTIEEETWNLSGMARPEELEARLEAAADAEKILRLHLAGLPGFQVEAEALGRRFAPAFYHLEIVLEEEAGAVADLDALCAERTIRGLFAQIAKQKIAEATDEESREILSAALRHGLAAFGREEQT
jgi:DNA repair protein SbcD/Mre11